MIEQETASIIKFILDSSKNPAPYYYRVPQNFVVPSVYFPVPEVSTRGETLKTFACEFEWFIKFFHENTQGAYNFAYTAMTTIKAARNLIPLITQDGGKSGIGLRVKDLAVNENEDGVVQLRIAWDSRRPYLDPEYMKMVIWHTNLEWLKEPKYQEKLIPDYIAEQIEQEADLNLWTQTKRSFP